MPNRDRNKARVGSSDVRDKQDVAMSREFKDRIVMLTIAYHNLAVEQEYLRNVSEESNLR